MHRLKFLCFTAFCAAVTTVSGCNDVTDKSNEDMEKLELTTEWDKVFPQSDKVDHSKITFHNRYGVTLAADLYIPKNASGKLPAIAMSGPYGAVKEQVSGLYAQTLAERGFVLVKGVVYADIVAAEKAAAIFQHPEHFFENRLNLTNVAVGYRVEYHIEGLVAERQRLRHIALNYFYFIAFPFGYQPVASALEPGIVENGTLCAQSREYGHLLTAA